MHGFFAERYTPRQRAALPGSPLDRWIAFLKRALPMSAAAVAAAILVFTLQEGEEFSFILSRERVDTVEERLRLQGATYRGADSLGRPFTITARDAVQRSSSAAVVELADMTAQITLEDGPARVAAARGRYHVAEDLLQVAGPVRFASPQYRVTTGDLAIDLAQRTVTSLGPVQGTLPLGSFRANRMQADIRGERVVLEGDAHLRIDPAARR